MAVLRKILGFMMIVGVLGSASFAQEGDGEGAQGPRALASFEDWSVFETTDPAGLRVCFALAEPEAKEPPTVNHGDVYMMVATWASGAAKEQPTFVAGYTLKEASDVNVSVGDNTFDLFPSRNEAFLRQEAEQPELVRAMRAGARLNVRATSARGTNTQYTFSLMGVSDAINAANEACA